MHVCSSRGKRFSGDQGAKTSLTQVQAVLREPEATLKSFWFTSLLGKIWSVSKAPGEIPVHLFEWPRYQLRGHETFLPLQLSAINGVIFKGIQDTMKTIGIERVLFWKVLYCSRQTSSSHRHEDRALFCIANNSAGILGKLRGKLASPVSSYFQDHSRSFQDK